jgi:hypothetical protein
MSKLGRFLALGVGAVGLLAGAAYTGDQTILGKSITVKNKSGDPAKRKVKGNAKEKSSPNTLVGNPTLAGGAGGAILTILANGGTPSVQSFVLNQGTSSTGKPFWSGDVQRHLDGVESHVVPPGDVQHTEMHERIFVPRESDVAHFSRLLCIPHRFVCAPRGEDPIRVLESDHLVVLQEIQAIGLQTPQRLVDLPRGGLLRPAVDLGHQDDLVAVAVAEGLAHADLAATVVVVPAVVHEGDAVIDGAPDNADPSCSSGGRPMWWPPSPIRDTCSPVRPSVR